MERKLPGKFGYTKCWKIVITGAVNRKMLFHSLLEVAGNSNRKFWLNGKQGYVNALNRNIFRVYTRTAHDILILMF